MAGVFLGSVFAKMHLDTTKFNTQVAGAKASMGGISKSAKIAGAALAAFSVAGVAALGAAAKQASKFEQRMVDVSTLLAGDSTDAVNEFKDGILDMAKEIPKSPDDLGASAYAIVSAGFSDAAQGLDILEQSARLGTAGLGSTEEATTLMTLALNNFRDSGLTSAEVSDVLFKTVKNGITTVGEMSKSFGLVAPLAVNAGVSIEELSAATAALTQVNKSASISQNSIKAALVSLGKPTKQATELFDKLGVKTFPELIDKTGGMVNAFAAMQEASDGNEAQFAGAIGSGEALSSVLALLGSQGDAFKMALDDMTDGADAVSEAFDKQKKSTQNQMKLLSNNFQVLAIKIGDKVLPLVNKFINFLLKDLVPLLKKTKDFVVRNQNAFKAFGIAAGVLGTIFLATLIPAMVTWAAGALAAAAAQALVFAPWLAAGLIIAGIAWLILENWETIRGWFLGAWAAVEPIVTGVFTTIKQVAMTVFNALKPVVTVFFNVWKIQIKVMVVAFKVAFAVIMTTVLVTFKIIQVTVLAVWSVIKVAAKALWFFISTYIKIQVAIWKGIFNVFKAVILGIWNGIKATAMAVWGAIGSTVTGVADSIKGGFQAVVDFFKGAWNTVSDAVTSPFKTAFNAIANLWNSTVGKLSFTIPGWVPGIGGKGWTVPNIPMLAAGGIVTQPTLALIGEGAESEVVMPLSKLVGLLKNEIPSMRFNGAAAAGGVPSGIEAGDGNAMGTEINIGTIELPNVTDSDEFVRDMKLKMNSLGGAA